MNGKTLIEYLKTIEAAKQLSDLYGSDGLETARLRYISLIEGLIDNSPAGFQRQGFPETAGDLRLFSVPGRSELGGNHTDHNHGKVLAASINLDAAAVAAPRQDNIVFFRSTGHKDVRVDLSDLSVREDEKGNTEALIRGIAAEFFAQDSPVGGFTANGSNLVLSGSGLSSSAAVEILFAKIFDNLYCGGKRSALELAKIGQKAENVYFGKPCGLMDQTACASGGAVAIDFADVLNPHVKRIDFDPEAAGFALCVVATGGNHADLVPEYAAIPNEMKAVAAFFSKPVLREVDEDTFMSRLWDVRKIAGDRAALRAIHFFNENCRVDAMLSSLEKMNIPTARQEGMKSFFSLVNESGDSSWQFLQNIYPPNNPGEQGLSLALALTKNFFRMTTGTCCNNLQGACRVHGGGFAGTIQAYISLDRLDDYRKLIENFFGEDSLTVIKVRNTGATEIF